MLRKIITSRTRAKLLEFFLSHPHLEIHLREISRQIGANINSTRRELNHLEDISLLESRMDGNQKYFKFNIEHPIYPDLKSIYLKTRGIGDAIRNELEGFAESANDDWINARDFDTGVNVNFANVDATLAVVYLVYQYLGEAPQLVVLYEGVPEPGSLMLVLSGIVGLVFYGWRRKK